MDDSVSKDEVLRTLDKINETTKHNPLKVQEYIFNAMEQFANLFFEKKQQQGGAFPDFRSTTNPSLVTTDINVPNISIDDTYKKIKDKLRELDAKNREIASIIGPVAYIHGLEHDPGVGPLPPYLPIRLTIPKNSIIPVITYATEALRLMATVGPLKSEFLRKLLSISLGLFDIVNGEWKNGVLSLIGIAGETPMLIGLVGRLIRQVWNFVSPDLQNDLEDNLFDATKSIFAGFWLTMVSTFAPEFLRELIDGVLDKVKTLAEQANESLEKIEQAAQKTAGPLGLKVKFPRVPLEEIPSSDDLQNLLVILRRKEVICNPAVRGTIQPLTQQPVLRLLLELFNIPASDEAVAEKCVGVNTDLTQALTESLQPTIMPLASSEPLVQKGGGQRGGDPNKRRKLKDIKDIYIGQYYLMYST